MTSEDLKELRAAKGWSVAELAFFVGVSPATIESWECGSRNPGEQLARLSSILASNSPPSTRVGVNILKAGHSVRSARNLLRKTAPEMAESHGVKTSTWRAFEQGRRTLPGQIRDSLNKLIELRLEELGLVSNGDFDHQSDD